MFEIPVAAKAAFCSAVCTLATAAPGGEVQSWGSDTYGQSTVPSGDNFVQVTCGYFFSMGLLEDGTIVHWGMATSGVDDVPGRAVKGGE